MHACTLPHNPTPHLVGPQAAVVADLLLHRLDRAGARQVVAESAALQALIRCSPAEATPEVRGGDGRRYRQRAGGGRAGGGRAGGRWAGGEGEEGGGRVARHVVQPCPVC